MTRAEEYRGYARECRAIANRAKGFEEQIHLRESEMWGGLATKAEHQPIGPPWQNTPGTSVPDFPSADA